MDHSLISAIKWRPTTNLTNVMTKNVYEYMNGIELTTFVVIGTDYKGRSDTRDILPLGPMLNCYHIKLYRVQLTT
jgi:hypothetical protein